MESKTEEVSEEERWQCSEEQRQAVALLLVESIPERLGKEMAENILRDPAASKKAFLQVIREGGRIPPKQISSGW